jgi:hypothetical protein
MVLVERRRGFDWVIDMILIGRNSNLEGVTVGREVFRSQNIFRGFTPFV